MQAGRTVLVAVELLAAGIWVGSLVCLALVSSVARRVLDASSRIAFFRGIGSVYGIVGTAALLVAIAAGGALAGRPAQWNSTVTAAIALSFVLVALTVVGMMQARAMRVRRQHAVDVPSNVTADAVRRGAALAGALRGAMSLLTLVILVLGAHLLAG